jgi:myo-inositol-1(or 4)-monophosphatase
MAYHWTRATVAPLMLEAGRMALAHYEQPTTQLKADGSVVTEADRAIEAMFIARLEAPGVGRYLLGEETVASREAAYFAAGLERTLFIVDPIDGTAPYAHHIPFWGVSLGMAEAGRLTQGAVYLPLTRELFMSEGDTVYLAADATPDAAPDALTWQVLDGELPPYSRADLVAITQGTAKRGTVALPNPVHALACAVLPLTYLLLGRYAAYVASLKVWDLAGALPLLHKRGIACVHLDGTALSDRIDAAGYVLDPASPRCWDMHQRCVFAPPGSIDLIRTAISQPAT